MFWGAPDRDAESGIQAILPSYSALGATSLFAQADLCAPHGHDSI
jgi:hypothetical protein